MGVCLCPCDGGLDPNEYRTVVDQILEGIRHRSELLLEPLVRRMEELASERRYEDAAWARDRHEALAVAIETTRTWVALAGLGICEMEGEDGSHVIVDHGRLVCTWRTGSNPPLRPAPEIRGEPENDVPDSVETAEEARLIWNWMKTTRLHLVEATGTLALPLHPVTRLGTRSAR